MNELVNSDYGFRGDQRGYLAHMASMKAFDGRFEEITEDEKAAFDAECLSAKDALTTVQEDF